MSLPDCIARVVQHAEDVAATLDGLGLLRPVGVLAAEGGVMANVDFNIDLLPEDLGIMIIPTASFRLQFTVVRVR